MINVKQDLNLAIAVKVMLIKDFVLMVLYRHEESVSIWDFILSRLIKTALT